MRSGPSVADDEHGALLSDDPVASAFTIVAVDAEPPSLGRVRQARRLFDALTRELDTGRYDLGLNYIDDMPTAAHRMLMALPGMNPWNELIGPFYGVTEVMQLLGVGRTELDDFIADRRVLVTPTLDRVELFPTFQFGESPILLPYLREVLLELDLDGLEPWESARWLNRWSETLAGTPTYRLRAGRAESVIEHARRWRRRSS